jgi:outer membrane protein OmpA-like peptidoglycan-associated protein
MAIFQQRGKDRLRFTIEQHPLVTVGGTARVYATPTLWRHDQPIALLGETLLQRGTRPLYLSTDLAEKLLLSLSQGLAAMFSYPDPLLNKQDQTIALTPTHLTPALKDFRQCVNRLSPFNPENLDLFEVRFSYGGAQLGRQAAIRLDELIARLSREVDVTGLTITGFTDSGGRPYQNEEMAHMRALSVENYLLAAGVGANLIQRKYLGQAQPRYSNQNAKGRTGTAG